MANVLSAAFSLVSYIYFFWSLPLAATGFMINLSQSHPMLSPLLPYNIDFNPKLYDDVGTRLLINVALLGIFAIPHSIFVREDPRPGPEPAGAHDPRSFTLELVLPST